MKLTFSDVFVFTHKFGPRPVKQCNHQMYMHYTMENIRPPDYDIYSATRTDAEIYASYNGNK
jgi:hypothetical protein